MVAKIKTATVNRVILVFDLFLITNTSPNFIFVSSNLFFSNLLCLFLFLCFTSFQLALRMINFFLFE